MAKRAFQAVILFFAICGFLFVPLGKRTAIEHLQAIAGTPAAQQAASEMKSGVVRLVERLRSGAKESEADVDRSLQSERGVRRKLTAEPERGQSTPEAKREKPRGADRKTPETAGRAKLIDSAPAQLEP